MTAPWRGWYCMSGVLVQLLQHVWLCSKVLMILCAIQVLNSKFLVLCHPNSSLTRMTTAFVTMRGTAQHMRTSLRVLALLHQETPFEQHHHTI